MLNKKNLLKNLFFSIFLASGLLSLLFLPVYAGTKTLAVTIGSLPNTPISTDIQPYGSPTGPAQITQIPEVFPTDSPNPTSTFSSSLLQPRLITATITITPTTTITPTATITPTDTPTPIPSPGSFLPLLFIQHEIPTITPPPPEKVLFCDTLTQPLPIPDNDPGGVDDSISVPDFRLISDLNVYLDVSHGAVGNLVVSLTSQYSGETITVLNLPGNPPGECSENDIIAILDDEAAQSVDTKCSAYPLAISGIYQPTQPFNRFSRMLAAGTWKLNVSDKHDANTGSLNHWCLEASLSTMLPELTPVPTPISLPPSAYVDGMSGQNQQLNLDCESRSAVDWAKHFGFYINELGFLNNLPVSDDPEVGFVGDPDGIWGNIPPDDYGVHAPPVAALLREYGLEASSRRSLSWDALRAEIVAGRPVIVWIIGSNSYNLVNGIPYYYTPASTHITTIVAPHEHTVIVVGYSSSHVTVLSGSRFVDVPIHQFLDSWSVMQFMAVISSP